MGNKWKPWGKKQCTKKLHPFDKHGADHYEYCLRVGETNVELNNKVMKSYQYYIDGIEIEDSPEKLEWDKLNQVRFGAMRLHRTQLSCAA